MENMKFNVDIKLLSTQLLHEYLYFNSYRPVQSLIFVGLSQNLITFVSKSFILYCHSSPRGQKPGSA